MIPAISQHDTPYNSSLTQFSGDETDQDVLSKAGKREVAIQDGDKIISAKEWAEIKAGLEEFAEFKASKKAREADKVTIPENKGIGTTASKAALKSIDEVMGSYKNVKLWERPFAFLYPARLKKAFKNTREYYKSLTPEDKLRSWVGVAWQVLVDTTLFALTFGIWQGIQIFAQNTHSSSLVRRFYAEIMTDYNENRKAKKEHSLKETSKPAEPTDTKADKK
jgi:hypothetical protein